MGWKKVEEFMFYQCLFFLNFTAEARKVVDLQPLPQDLLFRSSLYLHFTGRWVQVRQRQLEADPLHKRGEFPLKNPVKSDQVRKQKQTSGFIRTWMGAGPPSSNEQQHAIKELWYFWDALRALGFSHNGTPSAEGGFLICDSLWAVKLLSS